MSSQTQSPPGDLILPPMTLMDFLDPSALNELLSPTGGNGSNAGPSSPRYHYPPYSSQPQQQASHSHSHSQSGDGFEGSSQTGYVDSNSESVSGRGVGQGQRQGQGSNWNSSEQREQVGGTDRTDQVDERDVQGASSSTNQTSSSSAAQRGSNRQHQQPQQMTNGSNAGFRGTGLGLIPTSTSRSMMGPGSTEMEQGRTTNESGSSSSLMNGGYRSRSDTGAHDSQDPQQRNRAYQLGSSASTTHSPSSASQTELNLGSSGLHPPLPLSLPGPGSVSTGGASAADFFDFDLGGYGLDVTSTPGGLAPAVSSSSTTSSMVNGHQASSWNRSNQAHQQSSGGGGGGGHHSINGGGQQQSQSNGSTPSHLASTTTMTLGSQEWTMQTEAEDDVSMGPFGTAAEGAGDGGMGNMMGMGMDGMDGLDLEVGQELQRQLEQIHMQSPALFASLSQQGRFPAQIQHPAFTGKFEYDGRIPPPTTRNFRVGNPGQGQAGMFMGKGFSGANGLITPAQSSEILANIHEGLVSPVPMTHSMQEQDGTFAINQKGEIVFTPLLSPAITQPSDSSNTSPHFGSNGSSSGRDARSSSGMPNHHGGNGNSMGPSSLDQHAQLRALQQQQLNIQRQLDAIQQSQQQHQQQQGRQSQMAHSSPFVSPMLNAQSNGTGGFNGGYQTSSRGGTSTSHPTPNSEFFSPLTSPALDPVQMSFRSNTANQNTGNLPRSRGHTRENSISTAMSPGYATGVNNQYNGMPMMKVPDLSNVTLDQTLSPALLPQPDAWKHQPQMTAPNGANSSSSQAYLEELARMINAQDQLQVSGGTGSQAANGDVGLGSDQVANNASSLAGNIGLQEHMAARRRAATVGKSPALRPSRASTGRTRPSPMMKPTHRPGRGGANTVPPSPLVAAYTPPIVPSSARGGQLDGRGEGSGASESLSPVDLSQMIMPPPPPPSQIGNKTRQVIKGKVAPITPSVLMQMGSSVHANGASRRTNVVIQTNEQSIDVYNNDDEEEQQSGSSCGTPKSGKRSLTDVAEEPRTAFEKLSAGWSASLRALRPSDSTKNKVTRASKANKPNNEANIPLETKKSSHKAAEQKRRDSLKAGFDELRLLLPPINTEALDPETGEPIPGSSAPRLLPKSSLVPDDNPNKGVSKVALLKYSNEYIERMQAKLERRNNYIDLLKDAIQAIRIQTGMSPDDHVDELLGYAFEDEDEEEEPTGASSSKLAKRPSLAEMDEEEEHEEMQVDAADHDVSGKASRGNAKARRKSTSVNGTLPRPKTPRRKSSMMITTSADSSLATSPMLNANQQRQSDDLQGLDTDMI